MSADRTSPSGARRQPPAGQPSITASVLLILTALLLWLMVARELIMSVPVWERIFREFGMKLPALSEPLMGLSYWFTLYWWTLVPALLVALPVVVLVTYWVRHRRRSLVLGWAWGALLILPPLVLLQWIWLGSFLPTLEVARYLGNPPDEVQDYLDPAGRLYSALELREVSREGVGQVLRIEPGGDWRITPLPDQPGAPPLRQGKLEPGQVLLLARHLATQKCLRLAGTMPGAGPPPASRAGLSIGFSYHEVFWPGLSRAQLRSAELPPDRQLAEEWAHFVALVLVIDDLVGREEPR